MKKPNVLPLNRRVLIHVPYTETEKTRMKTGLNLSGLSENTKIELEKQIYEERGSFFEVVGVSPDTTSVKEGDFVKFVFPHPTPIYTAQNQPPKMKQYEPETFFEYEERFICIPDGFLTAILKDANLYKQQRAEDALLKSIPAIEIAKA